MKNDLKILAVALAAGLLTVLINIWAQSKLLDGFIYNCEALKIFLAIIAIHATFIALLIPKIQELSLKYGNVGKPVIKKVNKEVKKSINQQGIILTLLSLFTLIIIGDSWKEVTFSHKEILTTSIFLSIFYFGVWNFYDTIKALIILLDELADNITE